MVLIPAGETEDTGPAAGGERGGTGIEVSLEHRGKWKWDTLASRRREQGRLFPGEDACGQTLPDE